MKKIMPPEYFMLLLFLSVFLYFIFPVVVIPAPYNYSGLILIFAGILLNLWTDNLFKKEKTTVKPHELPKVFITTGLSVSADIICI